MIAFLTIVSLRKHRHELHILLHDNDIDVIGLCETRLDEKVADSDVSIAGYTIFRNDRDMNGGGVAIYVKESFPEPSVKLKKYLEPMLSHPRKFIVTSLISNSKC